MPLLSLCFTQSKNLTTLCFSVCKTGFPFIESPWQPLPMPTSCQAQLIQTLVTRSVCGTASRVTRGEEEALLPFLSSLIHPWGCDCLFHSVSHLCLHRQSVVDETIRDLPFCHGQLPLQVTAACLPAFVCTYGWGSCLSHPRNDLFFHAGSCSLNFKFIIFCHTLQESSLHFISLAQLELLKNTDLKTTDLESWRYKA